MRVFIAKLKVDNGISVFRRDAIAFAENPTNAIKYLENRYDKIPGCSEMIVRVIELKEIEPTDGLTFVYD